MKMWSEISEITNRDGVQIVDSIFSSILSENKCLTVELLIDRFQKLFDFFQFMQSVQKNIVSHHYNINVFCLFLIKVVLTF